jgi:hypothetical protein
MHLRLASALLIGLLAPASLAIPSRAVAQTPAAVLVELFTSEGCSDCPPADDVLRLINGHRTPYGQLVIGISEHVTYWNRLGWTDPFSSDIYTSRQNAYANRFGLDSVYTPQSHQKQIALHIQAAAIKDGSVTFTYSAADLPAKGSLDLVAVLVDDMDHSSVLRGENSGRELQHVAVARAIAPLGKLAAVDQQSMTLPLPPSFLQNAQAGHHLVLFAQQRGAGAVLGIDTRPI